MPFFIEILTSWGDFKKMKSEKQTKKFGDLLSVQSHTNSVAYYMITHKKYTV